MNAAEIASGNVERALTDGPRLSYGYGHFVGAIRWRDGKEEVLLSGLGGMGVGTMWQSAEGSRHLEGYQWCLDGWWHDFWWGWRKEVLAAMTTEDKIVPTKEQAEAVMSAYLGSIHGPGHKWVALLKNPEADAKEGK